MTVTPDILLRGFLSHLHGEIRKLIALEFERANHSEAKGRRRPESPVMAEIRNQWNELSKELVIILGPGAELKRFERLGEKGSFSTQPLGGRDPFRITMKALKIKADKARRRNPKLTLLREDKFAA